MGQRLGLGGDAPSPAATAAEAAPLVGASVGGLGSIAVTAFSRKVRPFYITLLLLQIVLLVIRWCMGDAHGALLMLAVTAVGILAISIAGGGIDVIYGGYFGLMAFVSGLLDLNIAIEHVAWHHSRKTSSDTRRQQLWSLAMPALYLVCASVQLCSSLLAYFLYKDMEAEEDLNDEPIFATPEQARVYNAIVSHAERRHQAPRQFSPAEKAFSGKAHKLPI